MSRFCSCVMADEFPVKLYVYDLSKGMARQLSLPFLGRQIEGIWHTAIVCYDTEFFFGGGGIDNCGPGGTILGQPDSVVDMGKTQIPHEIFIDYLKELGSTTFRADTYNLFEHNCNDFSNEVAQFLVGRSIPSQITSLPQEVLSTPFGAMIKPFVDSMQVHPSGGQQSFRAQQGQGSSHGGSASKSPRHGHGHGRDRSGNSVASPPSASSSSSSSVISSPSAAPWSPANYHPASPPVLYKEVSLPDQASVTGHVSSLLSEGEVGLLAEIFSYAAQPENDISLSRAHLKVLDKLLRSERVETPTQVQVLVLMQKLMLHQDFVSMVCADPEQTLAKLFQHLDRQAPEARKHALLMLVNCSGCAPGHAFLSGMGPGGSQAAAVGKLVKDAGISCLLQQEDRELTEHASALIHNLSLGQIDDDMMVELGSAVLEVLQRDISSKTGEHSLTALSNFIQRSPEVKSLTEVMGLAWSSISSLSPAAETLCKQIQACYT